MASICIIAILFFFDKNKMSLFSQSIYKTDYHSLYITRNLQFTFFRFLFLICSIILLSTWISLSLKNESIQTYIIILVKIIIIIISRQIMSLMVGVLTNSFLNSKKLLLITIDIEFLICMLFFPTIFILTYIPYNLFYLLHILFGVFCFFLIFGKYFLIKKFNHLKELSFFNIILYLCVLDFIPIISLYKIIN